MPVLLVSADDDPYMTADVVRYSGPRLANAEVLICDSGGHVLLGQTSRVSHEVQRFIRHSGRTAQVTSESPAATAP